MSDQLIWNGNNFVFPAGLIPDKEDSRDYKVTDVLGAPQVDWEKGFNVFEELSFAVPNKDQGSSLSCTGQAAAQYARVLHKKLEVEVFDFSPKFIYSQIFLPNGGATLRDAIKIVATQGVAKETLVPSMNGEFSPTEQFMEDTSWKSDAIFADAKSYDQFSYRVIPGQTSDIDLFATSIQQYFGLLLGFTCSNNGWCKPLVSIPARSDVTYGHAVYGCGFGMYQGKKCIFTPNSWGNRYGIPEGRWKGLQAIPE